MIEPGRWMHLRREQNHVSSFQTTTTSTSRLRHLVRDVVYGGCIGVCQVVTSWNSVSGGGRQITARSRKRGQRQMRAFRVRPLYRLSFELPLRRRASGRHTHLRTFLLHEPSGQEDVEMAYGTPRKSGPLARAVCVTNAPRAFTPRSRLDPFKSLTPRCARMGKARRHSKRPVPKPEKGFAFENVANAS